MPEENVEIVKRTVAARNDGDIEATLADCHPEVEFDFSGSISPYRGVYRGHDGFRELWGALTDAWSDMRWEPEEYIEVGDAVIVPSRFRARGRGSGVETVAGGAAVYWLEEGKIVRFRQCQDRDDALEAVATEDTER